MSPNLRKTPVPIAAQQALLALGERITIARKARQMTQAELAQLSDVGISTVASIEAGYDGISIGNFFKVLNGLNLLDHAAALVAVDKDPEVIEFIASKLGRKSKR